MKTLPPLSLAMMLALACLPAQAESLRCNGQSTEVGDSRLSVLYKCGEPVLKDSFCAPVYTLSALPADPTPLWVPVPGSLVPCLQVDEWLYDRGPGNLMATVRFRSGVVQAIRYGRTPR
ncbi:MAG: hypothetical protein AD742_01160 [Methylibium sp. NZG]|nr:MAG: hypothetical protein AD742_01160 [Methylibium sp. NZG]